MKKILFLSAFFTLFLVAKRVEPKVMHGQDYERDYSHSSNHHHRNKDEILFSTFEGSSEITGEISSEITTDVTSGVQGVHRRASLPYLNDNRIEITEEMARGEGEHLETLLGMMHLKHDEESLKRIQGNFESLIYLRHNDFLARLTCLATL